MIPCSSEVHCLLLEERGDSKISEMGSSLIVSGELRIDQDKVNRPAWIQVTPHGQFLTANVKVGVNKLPDRV